MSSLLGPARWSEADVRELRGRDCGSAMRSTGRPSTISLTCPSSNTGHESGRRDSNPRLQPWEGCTLPLSYSRAQPILAQPVHRVANREHDTGLDVVPLAMPPSRPEGRRRGPATRHLGIHRRRLRRWADSGSIEVVWVGELRLPISAVDVLGSDSDESRRGLGRVLEDAEEDLS